MKNKDTILLEEAYSKILKEAQDISPENVDHDHPFNRKSHNDLTPKPDTSLDTAKTEADEEEEQVEETEDQQKKYEDEHTENSSESDETEDEKLLDNASFNLLDSILETIREAKAVSGKKNLNPWAIENAIEKKAGHKFSKKKKEEIVKGIKKSAKHAGKKITSKPIKKK